MSIRSVLDENKSNTDCTYRTGPSLIIVSISLGREGSDDDRWPDRGGASCGSRDVKFVAANQKILAAALIQFRGCGSKGHVDIRLTQ